MAHIATCSALFTLISSSEILINKQKIIATSEYAKTSQYIKMKQQSDNFKAQFI
jgi:hypothetical protein